MNRFEIKEKIISGIQQIGIGVDNLKDAWRWYKEHFGMDVRVFEEQAIADLMLEYTGGLPHERHAALTLNMQGGGGFEIWQYTRRTPKAPERETLLGDLGIYAAKIKSKDIHATHQAFKSKELDVMKISTDPSGIGHFFVRDPYKNIFQVIGGNDWFKNEKKLTGATYGAMIGVSDIDKARILYSNILGYDRVVYDLEDQFDDFRDLPGGNNVLRRSLLKPSKDWKGLFSRLFGPSYIELIQVRGRKPRKIYEGRQWGDLGFIHLCYDVTGMDLLRKECETHGFPFTVDSSRKHNKKGSFDIGEAAGQFSYVEDPDGTLIEFVETHKIPIIKKLGWYLNLRNRNPEKALPNWILKAMSFNRVKY